MNELKIFENSKFGELSVLNSEKYGLLFVGHEVATMAGYKKPNDAIQNLKDKFKVKFSYEDAKKLFSTSRILDFKISHNGLIFVNEPGLYKLASGKNEEFENWVFFDVLPSIRKTGSYGLNNNDRVELSSSVNTLERLNVVNAYEIPIANNQSYRAKLANLINDIAKKSHRGPKVLYEELYHVFAAKSGVYIPKLAEKEGISSKQYLRKPGNEVLSENLYLFAVNYFYQGKAVMELINLDPVQKMLSDF